MIRFSPLANALCVAGIAVAIGSWSAHFLEATRYYFLFVCAMSFVTLAALAVISRHWARDVATVLASISFATLLFEAFWLAFDDQNVYALPGANVALHAELGYGAGFPGVMRQTAVDAKGALLFDAVYTIDDHLNRKVDSSDSGPTIAFFGDSFTYGIGVSDSDTFPQAFADATDRRFRVLNFGFGGYGPHQFLRALETDLYDALLKRDPRLFVILTAPWHVYRSRCDLRWPPVGPTYDLKNGEVAYQGPCYSQRSRFVRRIQEFLHSSVALQNLIWSRRWPVRREDMDLNIALLVKAGAIARRKYGAPTLVMYLPENVAYAGPGYSDEDIIQKLREGGLIAIDGGTDPRDYPGQVLTIPGDGHPTGPANRIRAKRVKDFLSTSPDIARPAFIEGAK